MPVERSVPGRGDQIALQAGERLLVQGLPVFVVVQGVEVNGRDAEPGAQDAGEPGLAAAPAADYRDPLHGTDTSFPEWRETRLVAVGWPTVLLQALFGDGAGDE